MPTNDYQLTRDFTAGEFDCSHCGARGIKLSFVEVLQAVRDKAGPLISRSGYRCPKHPLEVIKATPGFHSQGIAADIQPVRMTTRDLYLLVLRDFPQITGIGAGRYRNTLHLDTRPLPKGQRAVVWAYDAQNKQARWSGRWEELPV